MLQRLVIASIIGIFASPANAQERSVAAMMELTGQFAKGGEDCRHGVEVAEDIFLTRSGSNLPSVKYYDSQGNPRAGLSEIERILTDQDNLAVIATSSPVAMAIAPVMKQANLTLLGVVGHPKFLEANPNAIRMLPSTTADGTALANHALKSNFHSCAILTLQSDYFTTLSSAFKERFLTSGKVVYEDSLDPTFSDLKTIATKIKASNPEVILANLGPNQLPNLLRELNSLGVKVPLLSNFLVGMKDMQIASYGLTKGVQYVGSKMEIPGFREKFKHRSGGLRPSSLGYSCFIGTSLAIQTIQKLGAAATREAVSQELLKTTTFTILGKELKIEKKELVLEPEIITDGG